MHLFVAGLSYRTAPVEVREKLATQPGRFRCNACRLTLSGGLAELVLVSTCNRVEIYGISASRRVDAPALFSQLSGTEFDFTGHIYFKEGTEAIEHLFAVAGGLDSMVIGETEITGQVKQAYLAAQEAKLTGKILNRLFQTALQVAKEIRTSTAIGRGSTSVGSVAVDLADRIFDNDLGQKTVMIIGAGKMGEACVRHLAKKGASSILVTNRSYEKAENLAAEFGGRPVPFDKMREALTEADIVVTSTGCPHAILDCATVASVMPARRNRPLFLIDIAVPRDIDSAVQQLPNVYLYNVDHLEAIVRENVQVREKELATCKSIIAERATALFARFQAAGARSAGKEQKQTGWILPGTVACRS